MFTLQGREVLLHSLTCLCSPLVCFSVSGNCILRQDVFCDTLTVDASAALGGDQLSWTHSQIPSPLKTQAAGHNDLLFSFWQATALKALLKVGKTMLGYDMSLTPPQECSSTAQFILFLPCAGCLPQPWPTWSPEGTLQCLLVQFSGTSATASSDLPVCWTSRGFPQSSLHIQTPVLGA